MQHSFHRDLVESSQFSGTQFSLLSWSIPTSNAMTPFVMIVHGIGEHAGRYDEVARHLNDNGFDVFAVDLPGHGHSKKEGMQSRCYAIEECSTEVKDALRHVLANKKSSETPWFLFAHSMGGLVALRIFIDHLHVTAEVPKPRRVFISAAPLKLRLHVPAWKETASKILLKLAPHLQLTNEIDPNMLSYSPENIKMYKEDPFVHPYSSSWQYDSIKRAARDILEDVKDFRIPMFMAVGADDPIVDPLAIQSFMDKLKCEKRFELIPHAKHEILNERDRLQLYNKIVQWFQAT